MKKKFISVTEEELHRIVKESVERVLAGRKNYRNSSCHHNNRGGYYYGMNGKSAYNGGSNCHFGEEAWDGADAWSSPYAHFGMYD